MKSRSALFVPAVLLAACGSDEQGELVVTAYGEEFIELGIDASDVEDGWAVTFSSFAVDVDEVDVAGVAMSDFGTIELAAETGGAGHELARVMVDEGDYSDPGYVLSDIRVVGSAQLDGATKSFDWSFPAAVRYENCETSTSVSVDDTATFEITVHSDHLLYDSLVADEPSLFFGPIAAADRNNDDVVSEAELAATDIGSYDPGNSGASDMWSYLTALVSNLGHVDGEGHCNAR